MIKDYWIPKLQNIKDFEVINDIDENELSVLRDKINNIALDQFIQSSTERGVVKREKLLNLFTYNNDTLDNRRFRILTHWNNTLPYTYNEMINKLSFLCGEDGFFVELNKEEYSLLVEVTLKNKRMINDVKTLINNIAPANLLVTVRIKYNQYLSLEKFTHEQLNSKTHYEIRNNEVI